MNVPKRKAKYKNIDLPFEVIDLPSKGIYYKGDLSMGKVEIKYPGVLEEDLLLTKNDVRKDGNTGLFIDSILMSDVKMEDMVLVDVDFIIMSAYMLSYGNIAQGFLFDYYDVDISQFDIKFPDTLPVLNNDLNVDLFLPLLGVNIELSPIRYSSIIKIRKEDPDSKHMMSNFLKYSIVSVEGDTSAKEISLLIKRLVTKDIFTIKTTLIELTPTINTTHKVDTEEGIIDNTFPIGIDILRSKL